MLDGGIRQGEHFLILILVPSQSGDRGMIDLLQFSLQYRELLEVKSHLYTDAINPKCHLLWRIALKLWWVTFPSQRVPQVRCSWKPPAAPVRMRLRLLATLVRGGGHGMAAPAAANTAIPISRFMNVRVVNSSDERGQSVSSFRFPKISNVQIYFTINGPVSQRWHELLPLALFAQKYFYCACA